MLYLLLMGHAQLQVSLGSIDFVDVGDALSRLFWCVAMTADQMQMQHTPRVSVVVSAKGDKKRRSHLAGQTGQETHVG